jgi:uncharacterized protein YecT (DUF1311 family)
MKWLIALMFVSSAVMAQDCKYDGSQLEMNACAQRDYKSADAALNKAYFAKVRKLSKSDVAVLLAEQRDWLHRRDARCKMKTDTGSNATIDHLTCLQNLTEIRTLQLR